ncbi:MAG: phosphoribosylglycinamide formyltransferase [bacterium]|nr:phosphoribosylglycinamide formyltransferase [bacterium]
MVKKIAIFISGRGSNMESLLKKSLSDNLPVQFIVVSDNPKANGLKIAENIGVKTIVLENCSDGWKLTDENSEKIEQIIKEHNISLVLLAGFMRIIPKQLIEKFPSTFVNIHPSLLPSFKGKNAQRDAFEYGVKISGCTVHFVDSGVDTGPIIMQKGVDISSCINIEEAKNEILKAEHELYYEALKLLLSSKYTIIGRRVIFGF